MDGTKENGEASFTMSLFSQWKTDSLRFWNSLLLLLKDNEDGRGGLWYSTISKGWSREMPLLGVGGGGGDNSSSSSSSSSSILTTKNRKMIQDQILKCLDRIWDYSYQNPDVVLFVVTFLVVRWDLRPYYILSSEKKSARTTTTTTSGKTRETPGRPTKTDDNDDDRTVLLSVVRRKSNQLQQNDDNNKKKDYKDKGLYDFMAQCQDKKSKLRPVVREEKKVLSTKSSDDLSSDSFLQLSPEKLRNLRGSLKSTPAGDLV